MLVRSERKQGFTLIELMIVVAIIAIIAAIAIPNLIRSRMAANESAAVGSLKTIATSQNIFARMGVVDQDKDGVGENGWLTELAGEMCPRNDAAVANPHRVSPAFISASFATAASGGDGLAEKSGYFYRMYLCAGDPSGSADALDDRAQTGTAVAWGACLDPVADFRAISLQENSFCCQAWPQELRSTGARAFAVNELGLVYGTKMSNVTYTGIVSPMADYTACYSAAANNGDTCFNDHLAAGAGDLGNDGNVWSPAG